MVLEGLMEKIGIRRGSKTNLEIVRDQWVNTLVPARHDEARKLFEYWTREFDTKLGEPNGKVEILLTPYEYSLQDEAFLAAFNARMTIKPGIYGEGIHGEDLEFAKTNHKNLRVQVMPNFITINPEPENS